MKYSNVALASVSLVGILTTWSGLSMTAGATGSTASFPGRVTAEESEDDGVVERELDPRDVVGSAKIDLKSAIENALKASPGVAVEAGLEAEVMGKSVSTFYEVMIVGNDKQLHEVKLSHLDGGVIEQSVEADEEELEELAGFIEALRHSDRSLTELVSSAQVLVKGKPVSASLELDEEGPECEVLIVKGRYLAEVAVEARAGHIVELELRGAGQDDDEDDADFEEADDDEEYGGAEDDESEDED